MLQYNVMNTPGSPTRTANRTASRLNQAIADLTGDEYFRSHPFFHPDTINGDIGVYVSDPVRLAEVFEGLASERVAVVDSRPQPGQGQQQIDLPGT